jgi:hypothetical protein
MNSRSLHAARSGVGRSLFEQARLADPGLTLHQHDHLAAAGHPVQRLAHDSGLGLAPAQLRSQRRDAHETEVTSPREAGRCEHA